MSNLYDDNEHFLVEVSGESCWPELIPGKKYLATKSRRPKVGDFAVFKKADAPNEYLVKKISMIKKDEITLSGTVSWSAVYSIKTEDMVGKILK